MQSCIRDLWNGYFPLPAGEIRCGIGPATSTSYPTMRELAERPDRGSPPINVRRQCWLLVDSA